LTAQVLTPADGKDLFRSLHIGLQLAIWFLVPLLTADCISRERRENTLGLLFLTPLGAFDIVIAKSLVHALRGVLLWLAVLPVLAQMTVCAPSRTAWVMAAVMPRSLKEPVGFSPSNFRNSRKSRPGASVSASRGAAMSGVLPSLRVMMAVSSSNGK